MADHEEAPRPDPGNRFQRMRDRLGRVTLEIAGLEELERSLGPPPPEREPARAVSAPPSSAAAAPAGADVAPEPARVGPEGGRPGPAAGDSGEAPPSVVVEDEPRAPETVSSPEAPAEPGIAAATQSSAGRPVPIVEPGAPGSAAPGGSPRRLAAAAVACAAAAACVAGLRHWAVRRAAEVHRSVALPFAHAVGLSAHDGLLSTLDYERMLLYNFRPDPARVAAVAGLEKLANPSATGLSWGKNAVWSTDAVAGMIYEHRLDPGHAVRKAFANRDRKPTAIYWDGAFLWTGDARTETVYQYSVGDSLTAFNQFGFPGIVPAGLYVSDGVLWILDAASRRILRFQLKALAVPQDSLNLDAWLPAASRPTGFAVDGGVLWVVTEAPAALHRIDLRRVSWAGKIPS